MRRVECFAAAYLGQIQNKERLALNTKVPTMLGDEALRFPQATLCEALTHTLKPKP